MTTGRIARIALFASLAVLLSAFLASSGSRPAGNAQPHPHQSGRDCKSVAVGGSIITNFGGFGPNTTLGTATGDLRGAVGVNIVGASVGTSVGSLGSFTVQHHWVTESGDTLSIDQAIATGMVVGAGLFAIQNYSAHLSGGTGKFAGATGDFTSIGEADLIAGQLVLRYRGQVCFADAD